MTATESKTIRLLLVDDHEIVRVGLKTLLAGYPEIEIVGDAGTVADAISEADRTEPDLVLLDVRLPDGSGFEASRQIQAKHPRTRILILTSYADDKIVLEAVDSGVDGYLLKEIGGESLVQAIKSVALGQSILDPVVVRRVISQARPASQPDAPSKFSLLSAQEKRVIALVAEGKTNKEIAADLGLSDKTVKNYLSNVLEKLNMSRRSQAAAFYVQNAP